MGGSEAQAGFYYQNIIAAHYALKLIEFGNQFSSITFENPQRAKHIDDIVVDHTFGTIFIQVKWAHDETSAFTLHNLCVAEDNSTSLLLKLARGYCQAVDDSNQNEIILLSTRRAGTNKQPGLGFNKSLAEFLNEFHQPYAEAADITDIRQAEAFKEYESILERLLTASDLKDLDELSRFLKCLRFRLNEPDRDTMVERVHARLAQLGIEQRRYATLIDNIIRWSFTNVEVKSDDVLRVLGVHDHFIDRVSHYFPIDRSVWVKTMDFFEQLDSSIESLDSGFILVEGEPGIGKSTALTMYLSERSNILFGYYCFVPNDRTLGNDRLGDDAFVRSICIGLKNAFPDIEFPRSYAPHTVQLLSEWLHTLSSAERQVVFIVDGLDHVDRKTHQSLVAYPLTTVLDTELPSNVLIVLSSRYPEALPPHLIDHVNSHPNRHIRMSRFGRAQIQDFFRLREVGLADKLLEAVVNVSSGVPIYLEYLAGRLGQMNHYEQERYLESMPTLRNDQIDVIHKHLWETCIGDERLVYILAILTAKDEFTTPETLRELLQLIGVKCSLYTVHEGLMRLRHVLRISDAKSVAIRHSSLAEFIAEQTESLRDEITQAIIDWYDQNPDSDEAWRNNLRHLFRLGELGKILATIDDDWFERAWINHRPTSEIQRNLDIAWRAATSKRDVLEFVRIGLLKQRVALIVRNLDLSEVDIARLLLNMGHPDEALRRVWDGERRQCSSVGFASFSLAHVASTGRVPVAYILDAGLGEGPDPGSDIHSSKTWFRARILTGDPIETLKKIERMHWENKTMHGHVKNPIDEIKNQHLNLEIQMSMLRELVLHGTIDALQLIRFSDDLPEAVRVAAQASVGLTLARAGEDAVAVLRELDIACLPEDDQRWFFLKLAVCRIDVLLAPITLGRPEIPSTLLNSQDRELRSSLFYLYDTLRCFFLQDETGYTWFEVVTTGLAQPTRTLVSAIGRMAQVWKCWIRNEPSSASPLSLLKGIVADLNLQRELFLTLYPNNDHVEYLYRCNAYRFYDQAWSCAAEVLNEVELQEFVLWWAHSNNGELALYNPKATQALAKAIYERLSISDSTILRELLEIAEWGERTDEDSSVIASGLVTCAFAWSQCGFPDEAQRLWCEFLDVACGIYGRKDYQFNQIMKALMLAHKQDPGGTLKRIEEQLTLAHQLVDTAQAKTVAVAIEELIEFISRIDPVLALKAVIREEDFIYRDRALDRCIIALLDENTIDRRLLLALAATMSRWENHRGFNDHTKPTMFALYLSALENDDIRTARIVYDYWRCVLLVEKQMSSEVGRWAAAWIKTGSTPADVQQDFLDYPSQAEKPPSDPTLTQSSGIYEVLAKDLDMLTNDFDYFELRFNEGLLDAFRREQRGNLEQIQHDFRTSFSLAAKRDLSDEETYGFEQCFAEFIEHMVEVSSDSGTVLRDAARERLTWLLDVFSERFSSNVTVDDFGEFFDIEKWLDGLIRPGRMPYFLEQMLEERLPRWISAVPFAQLNNWEGFCHHHCSGEARASGLLALAERRSILDRSRAIVNLLDAWKCISKFFFEYGTYVQRICLKLLELDIDKGTEFLFESFRHQYQQFPEEIIYRLDTLLDFVEKLPRFDSVRFYDIWSAHNRHLTAGLSHKPTDLCWLEESVHLNFQYACLKYLTHLLKYPVVDVRLLAFKELFRLTCERPELILELFTIWSDVDQGEKEYYVALLFSTALRDPLSAEQWASQLVKLGQQEHHRNLRITIAEAVEIAAEGGAKIDSTLLADSRALKLPPRIIMAKEPMIYEGSARIARFPPYLRWSLEVLGDSASPGELKTQTLKILSKLYPYLEHGLEEEASVHRAYNINKNFDAIEISGEFDRVVRAALNSGVQILVDLHKMDHNALENIEDILRLLDPSDILVQRVPCPIQIAWINEALSDDEFTGFADLEELKAKYTTRDDDWLTVFECTEQRTSERIGSNPQRATKIQVMVFSLLRGDRMPTNTEIQTEMRNGILANYRNRYRFELIRTTPSPTDSRIIPIVVATIRTFRGRTTPTLAAIAPNIVQALDLQQNPDDLLGNLNKDGECIVRSIEWQEAFDQGRRLHEPRSAGFLLQMKRDMLKYLANERNMEYWVHLIASRTTDRYKPEDQMKWYKQLDIFPLRMT